LVYYQTGKIPRGQTVRIVVEYIKQILGRHDMYDIAIIGGGPAGLAAGLYGARGGMDTVLLENMLVGGQITKTTQVDNYPGFPDGIDGFAIGTNMQKQAERFGLEIKRTGVDSVELEGEIKRLYCGREVIEAKAVIIATGAHPKKLELDREEKLTGAGVSYCATCDGAFFRNATVAVAGGGDTAVSDALYLSRFAKKVYVIHRRDKLRAAETLQRAMFTTHNIEFVSCAVIIGLIGEDELEGLTVKSTLDGGQREIPVEGLFIAVGVEPSTELFADKVSTDEAGRIITDKHMQTDISGVYAAGDVRDTPLRQVVTAAADGAIAATSAIEHIMKQAERK
jgi:thioredoxin reductase (NADPH)